MKSLKISIPGQVQIVFLYRKIQETRFHIKWKMTWTNLLQENFTKGVLQFLQLGSENKCFANSKKMNRLRARLNCDYFIIMVLLALNNQGRDWTKLLFQLANATNHQGWGWETSSSSQCWWFQAGCHTEIWNCETVKLIAELGIIADEICFLIIEEFTKSFTRRN